MTVDAEPGTFKWLLWHLASYNHERNGRGTPREELVRQASKYGIDEGDANDALDSLQALAMVYEVHPGLIVPIDDGRNATLRVAKPPDEEGADD